MDQHGVASHNSHASGLRRQKAGNFSLDELREKFRVKDHTAANVKALSRGAAEKHKDRTILLAKKLLAQNKARLAKTHSNVDSSSDDEGGVDMYRALRMMKSHGL